MATERAKRKCTLSPGRLEELYWRQHCSFRDIARIEAEAAEITVHAGNAAVRRWLIEAGVRLRTHQERAAVAEKKKKLAGTGFHNPEIQKAARSAANITFRPVAVAGRIVSSWSSKQREVHEKQLQSHRVKLTCWWCGCSFVRAKSAAGRYDKNKYCCNDHYRISIPFRAALKAITHLEPSLRGLFANPDVPQARLEQVNMLLNFLDVQGELVKPLRPSCPRCEQNPADLRRKNLLCSMCVTKEREEQERAGEEVEYYE